MKISSWLLVISSWFLVLMSCGDNGAKEPTDTPTSGEVNICIDESYKPLLDAEIYTFEAFYRNAKIHTYYIPESKAIQMLLTDSCKVAILNRSLTEEEKKVFESKKIFPIITKIAEDGVAFIVNKENDDSVFTVEQIKAMLSGKDSLWSGKGGGVINVVFDNTGSANARYMKDSLLKENDFGKNVFAVKSNPDVIDYVNKNKNALGVISVNWISDSDDTLTKYFMKKVKVAAIKKDTASKAFKPYQSYIKTKEYPFCRDVYLSLIHI